MAAEDKTIKINFAVDSTSSDKLRNVLAQVTADVNKLVAATNNINFGGGKVSNFSAGGGRGSVSSQMAQKATAGVSGAGNGLVDGLTRAVTASSSLFKVASTGAIGSFKIMGDSLRDMVSKSDKEIARLEGSLSKLEKSYSRLKSQKGRGMSGPGIDAVLEENQGKYFDTISQLSKAKSARDQFQSQLDVVQSPKQSLFQRARMGFGNFANGLQDTLQGALGPMGVGAFVGGGLASAPAAAMMLTTGAGAFRRGNADYYLERPFQTSTREASYGQVFGGYALAGRNGDAATAHAISLAAKDADFKTILGSHYTEALVKRAKLGTAVGIGENLGVGAGGVATSIGQTVGRGAEYLIQKTGVRPDNFGGLTGQEIDREKAMALVAKYQPEAYAQLVANKMQSDPLFNQTANSMYQGVFGNISSINASRTSGNTIRDKYGNILGNSFNNLQKRIMNNMFDPNEVFGMMGQLSPVLGRQLSGPGIAEKILSMNIGGFGSAANVFSAGSQFGGGLKGGNALTGVFQRLIGGKGLDIGAGSGIGALVSQQMLGGGFLGSGEGLSDILLNAATAGNPGEQMFHARAMAGGLGAMDSFASGGLDRLQGAANMSAALQAAPTSSWQTKRLLLDLNSASLLDIVKTGKLPYSLERTGITVPMVRNYLQARNRLAFARTNDAMLSGSGRSAKNEYISQGIGFLKNYKGAARQNKLVDLANAMRTGTRHSFEEDYEMFRIEASAAGLLRGARGSGAGRSISRKSPYAAPASAQGENAGDTGEYIGAHEGELRGAFKATPKIVAPAEKARQTAIANATGDAEQLAENIQVVLMAFAHKMEEIASAAGSGRAGKPKVASRR